MFKRFVGKIWKKLPPFVRMKLIRVSQNKFTASAAAIITNKNKEILLLEHVLRPASGWGMPGGFMEYGEQPEQAICRELREETGLELENVKLYRARVLGRHIEFVFRAETRGEPEILSREILSAEWFELGKMPEKMNRAQKSLIEKVLSEEV
ncbi:MAG TPA: NUDIX hydrolase [Pyrinomonadaceae bacterium]|jgi:mutator protein MutT